jgi:hypothetical protein
MMMQVGSEAQKDVEVSSDAWIVIGIAYLKLQS